MSATIEAGVTRPTFAPQDTPQALDIPIWIYLLFFVSGVPAIIYQIVWQRALFALYGINIESVTVVVSAFMLGLGLGSLGGGVLSRSRRFPPVALFGAAEIGTALFGLASLSIFHFVADHTLARPLWVIGTISFLLVVIPTTLMGSTLPLLIEHLVRATRNVGGSVGALYFVNTLGSGAACIVAIRPLMNSLGQTGTVRCAVLANLLVGTGAMLYSRRYEQWGPQQAAISQDKGLRQMVALPFRWALLCAAFCGFAALSYEIVWYRLLSFASEDRAPIFASLLGSYLVGLAMGSRFAEGYAERTSPRTAVSVLAIVMLASAVLSFWINPLCAQLLRFFSPTTLGGWLSTFLFLLLVCHAAILFGALFPLIAHVSVRPEQAGRTVSYLYAANISGSTLGVLITGFILMDRYSLYRIAVILSIGGIVSAAAVFRSPEGKPKSWRSAGFVAACIVALLAVPLTRGTFSTIYDRLLFKKYYPARRFGEVIENRSGTIGITPDGTVFGGGVYDGYFNTDLLNDSNIIVRPYSLSALHAAPSKVLMIGLGSGSWAQVLANHPQIEQLTIVEINRGYLDAIPNHWQTASLLHNPKVNIIIDDGRRWLLRNQDRKFDAIIMNTSFHWRNHITNLLSADFLQIARAHLQANGLLFYNTTKSDDVIATGIAVFPYAVRVHNCIALSDSPLKFDRDRWRSILLRYAIDGKQVVDASDAKQLKELDQIVNVVDSAPVGEWNSIENNEALRQRLQAPHNLIITDDNMGLEWR